MEHLKPVLERQLQMIWPGTPVDCVVRIGPLVKVSPGRWTCFHSISKINEHGCASRGIDAIDALDRALRSVDALIRGAEEDGIAKVWWFEAGDNGCFGAP